MTQEDCVDATKLIMALFFKVRPQDFLAKERLQKEQSERVYEGLVNGVTEGEFILIIVWAIRMTICFVYRRLKIGY